MRLGLLQYGVERVSDFARWTARLDDLVAEAKRAGAQLLALPEYACVELAGAFVDAPDVGRELDAVCARADTILDAMRETARRHDVWLQPGSMPVRADGRVRNRAPLIAPDGRVAFQDKRVMTRFEAELWGVQPGDAPCVFETAFGRIGIAICYDVEFPALVRAQVEAGAWLILVPSCTDAMHGFNRVRLAARARAIENQCFLAIAPTVGDAPFLGTLDSNRGYAAVYGPVDRGFPEDGVLARGPLDRAGWLYCDLDPASLDAVRAGGAVRNHLDWPPAPPTCRVVRPT